MAEWDNTSASIQLKASPSLLQNNLSVLDDKMAYASLNEAIIVSKDSENPDTLRIPSKDKSSIKQVKLANFDGKLYCIVATVTGLQIWSDNGKTLNYSFTLTSELDEERGDIMTYCCGLAFGKDKVYVGTSPGIIFVFSMKNASFLLSTKLRGHQFPVTALDCCSEFLVSADSIGHIIVWDIENHYEMLHQINSKTEDDDTYGITSVCIPSSSLFVIGDLTGSIKIYRMKSGNIAITISAHARAITAMDCMDKKYLATVGEDTFLNIWKIPKLVDSQSNMVSLLFSVQVSDELLTGVSFTENMDVITSSYDNEEIHVWRSDRSEETDN